jgi:tetratricopeptide (TPR) repeat protein
LEWLVLGFSSAFNKVTIRFTRLVSVLLPALAVSMASAADIPSRSQSAQDLLAAGRVDQAVQVLRAQVQLSPSAESYNLLCRAEYELGAWDAGIPACEKATQLAPENGLYHLWLGRIYGEKADHVSFISAIGLAKKVRTEFERAVQFDPNSWESRTDLAEFYTEAPGIVGGGEAKARAQAEQIAPLNAAMAHWVNGRLAEKKKDVAAAEQEYRAAVDASQGGARACLNLASFYSRNKRFDDMELALHHLASSPLDHPDALVDGAGMLLRTGRDSSLAIQLLRRYIANNTVEEAPAFKAHEMLGELLEKQGDSAGAANEYRTALAMARGYRIAQQGLDRVTAEVAHS